MAVMKRLTEEEAALAAILSDDTGIDIIEMAMIDETQPDRCMRLRPYQWPWFVDESKHSISACARDVGKALDISTPIATPSGWTTMGELREGDYVFGANGRYVRVEQVHPIHIAEDSWDVHLSGGRSPIRANGKHLWLTETRNDRRSRTGQPRGPQIRTTLEIITSLTRGARMECNHSIAMPQPIELPEVDLPVDPYFLGYWLGDGSGHSTVITTMDKGVVRELESRGFELQPQKSTKGKAVSYGVTYRGVRNWGISKGLSADLHDLGVKTSYNRTGKAGALKHIPPIYLRGSIRQRLDLLHGLVDSDGHVAKANGRCEIISVNEVLAAGIAELLLTLGEKPTTVVGSAVLNGRVIGPTYRVGWHPMNQPAKLTRKLSAWRGTAENGRFLRSRIRHITAIIAAPATSMRCITVEGGMFLAGKDMVPTHNSFRIVGKALAHVHSSPGTDFFITAPGQDHLNKLVDSIEEQILGIRFISEMLKSSHGKTGISKVPAFEAKFKNKAKIITRLPKPTGVGLKAQHAKVVVVDEASDFPEPAWEQLYPTLKSELPGAKMELYGVTTGSNGAFDKHSTDPDTIFTVFRKIAPERPDWGDEPRKNAQKLYGSETSIKYNQNIFGVSMGVYSDLFVTARLMACVRVQESPWAKEYNDDVYKRIEIDHDRLRGSGKKPVDLMVLPSTHLDKKYSSYWGGWDLGFTRDPSEILIFGTFARPGLDTPGYRLLTRVSMQGIKSPDQVQVACWLTDFYGDRFVRMGMDGTGTGIGVAQQVDSLPGYKDKIKGYGFGEKFVVGWEDRPMEPGEKLEDLEIKQKAKVYGLDQLRKLIDQGSLEFPMDVDLLSQWQGIGEDHTLDAGFLFGIALDQHSIQAKKATMELPPPVLPLFGW